VKSKIIDTPCDGCVYNFRDKKCQMTPISNLEGKCLSCLARDTCLWWNPDAAMTRSQRNITPGKGETVIIWDSERPDEMKALVMAGVQVRIPITKSDAR
jgi:hypothetical protein